MGTREETRKETYKHIISDTSYKNAKEIMLAGFASSERRLQECKIIVDIGQDEDEEERQ